MVQKADQSSVEHNPEGADHQEGDDDCHGKRDDGGDQRDDVRAQHDQLAVSEIDDTHDAVDDRETQRTEQVDASERGALSENVDDRFHGDMGWFRAPAARIEVWAAEARRC